MNINVGSYRDLIKNHYAQFDRREIGWDFVQLNGDNFISALENTRKTFCGTLFFNPHLWLDHCPNVVTEDSDWVTLNHLYLFWGDECLIPIFTQTSGVDENTFDLGTKVFEGIVFDSVKLVDQDLTYSRFKLMLDSSVGTQNLQSYRDEVAFNLPCFTFVGYVSTWEPLPDLGGGGLGGGA